MTARCKCGMLRAALGSEVELRRSVGLVLLAALVAASLSASASGVRRLEGLSAVQTNRPVRVTQGL